MLTGQLNFLYSYEIGFVFNQVFDWKFLSVFIQLGRIPCGKSDENVIFFCEIIISCSGVIKSSVSEVS